MARRKFEVSGVAGADVAADGGVWEAALLPFLMSVLMSVLIDKRARAQKGIGHFTVASGINTASGGRSGG